MIFSNFGMEVQFTVPQSNFNSYIYILKLINFNFPLSVKFYIFTEVISLQVTTNNLNYFQQKEM